jgi:hypothetical protein
MTMEKNLKKLVLEKASEELLFYIQHADHSEETSLDYVIDMGKFNEEESDILYSELSELSSFDDLLRGEYYVVTEDELDNMYAELSNLTDNI